MLGLHPLADRARANKSLDVRRHIWPPDHAAGQGHGLLTAKMPTQRGRVQFSENQPPKFGVRGDAQAITTMTGTAAKQETGAPQIRGLQWRRGQRDRLPAAVDQAPGERTCCCG